MSNGGFLQGGFSAWAEQSVKRVFKLRLKSFITTSSAIALLKRRACAKLFKTKTVFKICSQNEMLSLFYSVDKSRQRLGLSYISLPHFFNQQLIFGLKWRNQERTNERQHAMPFSTIVDRRKSKFNRGTFIVKTFCVIAGMTYMELYLLKENFSRIIPEDVTTVGLQKPSSFVNMYDPMNFPTTNNWQSLMPWISNCASLDYVLSWRLAQETKSQDSEQRAAAIRKLATLKFLTDSECRAIAFLVDFRTSIELANCDADPRMVAFNKCRFPKREKVYLATKFRQIFSSLPSHAIHPEVHALAEDSIKSYNPTEDDHEDLRWETATGFESEPIIAKANKQLTELQFIHNCLLALLSHTRNREQIPVMLNYGTLELLDDIALKYEGNLHIMSIVAKILSNLSWHRDFYYEVKRTGTLRLIAELSQSSEFQLNLPARKALHNLDRSENTPMLPPGIYQLYPDFKTDESLLKVDVIFIHGIKGSTFRTWRAHDRREFWRFGSDASVVPPSTDADKSAEVKAFRRHIRALKSHLPFSYFINPESGSEGGEGMFRERLNSFKNRLYLPENPILGSDLDENHRPLNREFRDGKMYYFRDDEHIPLETSFIEAPPTKCWPRDWLPKDVNEARILSVDYDSFVSHWYSVRPVESLGRTVTQRSAELLEKLISAGVGERPIVWVTHSAGGVLVKQILLQAHNSSDQNMNQLCKNTKGVFFYSTPHFGSHLASLSATGNLLLPTIEMKEMSAGSQDLLALNHRFKEMVESYNYHVVSLGEMLGTLSGVGVYVNMVPLKSSDPGYGEYYAIKTDHLGICKPVSRGSFIYVKLVDYISNLLVKLKEEE